MEPLTLNSINRPLLGALIIPGDKSISHRAVILGALANGVTKLSNFLAGEDCIRTIEAVEAMGISVKRDKTTVLINGKGGHGFKKPAKPLYLGNSGTTARLMLGVLAGLPFKTIVKGDSSLSVRPMGRVVSPLKEMGAIIDGEHNATRLPLQITGTNLNGITYQMPIKSAQVKSAILLAGLHATGKTVIVEETPTRNHTELMLKAFGANITWNNKKIMLEPVKQLTATDIHIPGDISSAAFFLVGAALVPGSKVTLKNVGLNDTRTGIIDVLREMGADLHINNKTTTAGETYGDITISHARLRGVTIEGAIIPRLIDEIPAIALLATQAEGKTIIRNAEELKVKETDRIKAVVDVLSSLGAHIEALEDGMIIHGNTRLTGGHVSAYHDHRIAMMCVIASLIADQEVTIDDSSSISISYPTFFHDLNQLTQG